MSKDVKITSLDNLAWYLGCGLFQSGNYTILARDDEFTHTELIFVERSLEYRNVEFILDKNQIKIKNDESN
jgi:hypothetical protein